MDQIERLLERASGGGSTEIHLYDVSSTNYMDRQMSSNSWKEIGENVQVNGGRRRTINVHDYVEASAWSLRCVNVGPKYT